MSRDTETIPKIPDTPDISDEELKAKLVSMRVLTWVGWLIIPAFLGTVALIVVLNGGEEMQLGEFALKVILPIAALIVLMSRLIWFTHKRIYDLRALMGSAVTLPVLRELFDVKSYRSNGHIEGGTIHSAELIDKWEEISGSDYFEGVYRGVNILYSDVCLSHEEEDTDSDGKKTSHNVTDFKGQWMVCDFGKELSAAVRLIERKGGTKFQRKHDISKSDIETENVAFNKKFRIITADGHTAFYLLTPHFMERLMATDEAANASSLFCFGGGKVHIALFSGRDSFELKGVKIDSVDSVRQKFRRELKYLTGIVDELLSNDRLFM